MAIKEEFPIREEFQVHMLNEQGKDKATELASLFSEFLYNLERIVPPSRGRSLVVTKLQEASFFAKREIAMLPENQIA